MQSRLSAIAQHRLDLIERSEQLAQTAPDLAEFVRLSWNVLEPSTPLQWNWHIDAMCFHIQETLRDWIKKQKDPGYQQRIQNLLINVPPGSMKSRIMSVCTPAWMWLHWPSWRSLFLSSNPRVAMRDALFCRDLIESQWYQNTYRPGWTIRTDQNAKGSFWNSAGGQRQAFGMTSRVTGDRVDFLGVDDPHDAEEVNSDAQRQSVIDKWDSAIGNRVNDLRSSVRCGIMQRLHEQDWSGHVKKQGNWVHLCIPQEFEEAMEPTPLGWVDPRTQPGDLMFPERFTPEVLELEKKRLGSYGYAGQHQQRPSPQGGGMIKMSWFNRYTTPPANPLRIVQSWDCAASAKELASYWVCGTFAEYQGQYFLIDVYRKQMTYPEGKRMAISLAQRYNPTAILIENKSTGQALIPELRENPDFVWSIISIEPEKDKVTRMSVETPAIEGGRVFLPESAPWLPDVETELSLFPLGATADIVDVLSQFLKWAREGSSVSWISLYGR